MIRITLLTDFGTADGYVAAMKGVIAGIAPAARVEDATHEIPPGDVETAAVAFTRYWCLYPRGTVHVGVVDPGVGTARRALAARVDDRLFVAPDNGVLTRVFQEAPPSLVVSIENPAYRRTTVSATFHGRDIFAPAAAHLARGVPLEELGPPVTDPVRLELSEPVRTGGVVAGTVLCADRFGNLVTNIPGAWVAGDAAVEIDGRGVGPLRRSYADAEPGAVVALVGSTGMVEIAVRDGSAASALGVAKGGAVRVVRSLEG